MTVNYAVTLFYAYFARIGSLISSFASLRIKIIVPLVLGSLWVEASKVFPHNLRHLFARVFYRVTHDVAKLADLLGHSSIETTRIYLLSTGAEHARQLEGLGLVQ